MFPGERNGNSPQDLAWRIPLAEEPGGLQPTGLPRIRHNWETIAHLMWRVCVHAWLCLTLRHPGLYPPGSSVHGIFQARAQEWILLRGIFPTQGLDSCVSCIGRQILYHCTTREAHLMLQYVLFSSLEYKLQRAEPPLTGSPCMIGAQCLAHSMRAIRICWMTKLYILAKEAAGSHLARTEEAESKKQREKERQEGLCHWSFRVSLCQCRGQDPELSYWDVLRNKYAWLSVLPIILISLSVHLWILLDNNNNI